MQFSDKLVESIKRNNYNCVMPGLDTDYSLVPEKIRKKYVQKYGNTLLGASKSILEYNKLLIDSIYDMTSAIKVQIAYYEKYGSYGIETFCETVQYAKQAGLLVIEDAKRNDIFNTASAYSSAHIGRTVIEKEAIPVFDVDALIINPYMGSDTVNAFTKDVINYKKGLFILISTSNPSAKEIQNQKLENGKFLYEHVSELVEEWSQGYQGKNGYSDIGGVVGATATEEIVSIRSIVKNCFIVVPGFGAQGGNLSNAQSFLNLDGMGALFNNSREFITAYKNPKFSDLSDDYNSYIHASKSCIIDMDQKIKLAIKL